MKRKVFKIIYIVNIVIIISILAYLIYLAFSIYNHNNGNNQEYKYAQYRGYQFKLTDDTQYNTRNDTELLLYNLNRNWHAKIIIMNDPNNDIFNNLERLEEMLKYNGNDVSNLYIHTLDDQQYVTVKKKVNDENVMPYVLLGYCKLNDNRIAEITLNDTIDENSFNYGGFEEVVKILQSAKYDSAKDAEYKYWTLSLEKTLKELYGEDATSEKVE